MLTILALSILATAAFLVVAYGIAWCLAKAITAYQEHQEEKAARAQREANWNAARAARWTAV